MKLLVLVNLNSSGDLIPDWTQSHPENEVANVNSWHDISTARAESERYRNGFPGKIVWTLLLPPYASS